MQVEGDDAGSVPKTSEDKDRKGAPFRYTGVSHFSFTPCKPGPTTIFVPTL